MYRMRIFLSVLSIVCVGLFCATVQAEITLNGFQGTFVNSIEVGFQEIDFKAGQTCGYTASLGVLAVFDDLEVGLAGFTGDGDAVSISDLVLTGNGSSCSGEATYCWESASLEQTDPTPPGAGSITGYLRLQSSSTLQVSSDPVILPELVKAVLTYNGLVVSSDGSNGSAVAYFPSASISAIAVPEPSTIVCLLAGLSTLWIWRRRK